MNTLKNTVLAAAFILVAASAQAAQSPAETNRQITRGNGPADTAMSQLELVSVQSAKKTPASINRHTRTASDREAYISVSEGKSVKKEGTTAMRTASQRNRHS